MKFLLLIIVALLTGCAGSGENGAWTAQDTSAAFGAVNQGLDTYQRAQAIYYRQSYVPAP